MVNDGNCILKEIINVVTSKLSLRQIVYNITVILVYSKFISYISGLYEEMFCCELFVNVNITGFELSSSSSAQILIVALKWHIFKFLFSKSNLLLVSSYRPIILCNLILAM